MVNESQIPSAWEALSQMPLKAYSHNVNPSCTLGFRLKEHIKSYIIIQTCESYSCVLAHHYKAISLLCANIYAKLNLSSSNATSAPAGLLDCPSFVFPLFLNLSSVSIPILFFCISKSPPKTSPCFWRRTSPNNPMKSTSNDALIQFMRQENSYICLVFPSVSPPQLFFSLMSQPVHLFQ